MTPLRMGVVGLGSMGRHHARILSRLEGVEFVGGVDPEGDPYRALGGHRLFADLDEMLAAGIDAAVVAVPSENHLKTGRRLAAAGIPTLIEKPLAEDLASAEELAEAFDRAGVVAAVGHVERFNPALAELKRRLDANALGTIFAIKTQRVGPYPIRMRDTGVVKDLATHDIDLVLWLGGPVVELSCHVAHRLGRPHEDLIEAVGRLECGAVVTMSVNWLTPMKQRTVTVLGDRGALVADMLSADLTFYANADVPTEWDDLARIRGVSEGDMVRYALRKQEPLHAELEAFRDRVMGRSDAGVVTLEEGVAVVRMAEQLLEQAERAT